ncbi:MAG: polysaccharide deacetylase family protein [Granulosicoccaceae bacterium]
MSADKPKNLLRTTLSLVGVLIYRVGLAKTVINLSKNRVRALLYHAVEDDNNPFTKGLNVGVSPAAFSANLDYYKKHYNVIPVSHLGKQDLPPRPLIITFDDGYRSVYENAAAELHKRQMSACIYLISRAVRGELVWVNLVNHVLHKFPDRTAKVLQQTPAFENIDPDSVISQLQNASTPKQIACVYSALANEFPNVTATGLYASCDEISEMSEMGIEFGFHSADHFNLRNCNKEELAAQLDASEVSALMNNNTFAYPFGYYNQSAIEQLSTKNYDTVMTVGNNNRHSFAKHLDRTEVFTEDPALVFAQLEVVEPFIAWLREKILKSPAQTTAYDMPETVRE